MLEVLEDVPHLDYNIPDNEGNTPLHYAAQAGHVEVVSFLLNKVRTIQVDPINHQGFTPLMKSALQGRIKCSKLLLFSGKPKRNLFKVCILLMRAADAATLKYRCAFSKGFSCASYFGSEWVLQRQLYTVGNRPPQKSLILVEFPHTCWKLSKLPKRGHSRDRLKFHPKKPRCW